MRHHERSVFYKSFATQGDPALRHSTSYAGKEDRCLEMIVYVAMNACRTGSWLNLQISTWRHVLWDLQVLSLDITKPIGRGLKRDLQSSPLFYYGHDHGEEGTSLPVSCLRFTQRVPL